MTATTLPIATGRQTLAVAWRLASRRPGLLLLVVVVMLSGAAAGLVTPWALGALVDLIGDDTATAAEVWRLGLAILGATLFAAATAGVGVMLAARLFERMLAELREEFIARALALPQGVVERAGTGDLVSRASDDVAEVSDAIPQLVPALTSALFTVVVTVAGMGLVDGRFALALAVTIPVYALTIRWYLRTAPMIYAAQRAATATRAHHVLAALRGLDTVLAYRLSDEHSGRIAVASWDVVRWALRARVVQNMLTGRLNLAEYLGLASLLLAGFWLVQADLATIGGATTAVLLLLQVFAPVGELVFVMDEAQDAAASLSRIVGITRSPSAVSAPPAEMTTPAAGGPVASARRVTFSYGDSRPVLHEVDLHVDPGERVALVGASGAGKSTIAALLAGIHEPATGSVSRPARTLLLSQETHVFAGTLADNLRLARPDASDAELTETLTRVHAGGLLHALPDGLATPVGHGGHPLTAAQAQLLALARLLLADAELAILDEATAEADSADASLLDRAAETAISGRAALVVAHRLSQAASCDRVLVVDDGRIAEEGSPAALVAVDGAYARLWAAWEAGRGNRPNPRPPTSRGC
ncbi:ABC transporter ATP-binding protein [Microbacterium sp.]|uniref:ABC transporter ATP-binding protein n=1 Tax=Microbacterium sp. TaxID=51671 RepID=UPI0039E57897